MSYRLNNFVPFYLEYSDYNLKNVYIETKRKFYGKKVYKSYKKRLLEGIYKFGFYKDIINGELAVVDSGIKKIQIVKDEINGLDFEINLSWVFATKHLENQNDVFGYEYKSVYNLKLLCLALLRFENKNKILRSKLKVFNLKPSFKLGLNRRGLNFSSLVFKKRLLIKALLFKLLRFWHSGVIKPRFLKFFSFFILKMRYRLKNLTLLYFYYKLKYIRIFECLFLPSKVSVNETNTKLFRCVKTPPRWMLKRFGLSTRKKIVKGLFWTSYISYACGLWGNSKVISTKKHVVSNKLNEALTIHWDRRRSILHGSDRSLSFVKFFSLFYRNRRFHVRQKHRYSIYFIGVFNFLFNQILLHHNLKNVFYMKLFFDFMHLILKSSNFSNKKLIYESFLYFVCLNLQFRKHSGLLFSFFGFFDVYRHLLMLPSRMVDVFLYKERLFLYNVGLKYSVDAFNSYSVPLLKKYFTNFSRSLMNRAKYYLKKTNRRIWRWNKKYSWRWRKRFFLRRLKKRSRRMRLYFLWMSKYSRVRVVKTRSAIKYRLILKKVKSSERRKIRLTKTGKPYKKFSGKPRLDQGWIGKDLGKIKRWPEKRFNKRERNLGGSIQNRDKKQNATIR